MNHIAGIQLFPFENQIETQKVLKKLSEAHRYLAELKGVSLSIPNEKILIDTLSLQEAKDSSAIENIITTHDEIYRSDFESKLFSSQQAKEVHRYAQALKFGFNEIRKRSVITINLILRIQELIEDNNAGFRKLPGTVLKNDLTEEIIYTPPQHLDEIKSLMQNLELFINDDSFSDLDSLTKMALIHHQFESIHPFYDGNGRTGRIINILYLIKCELLHLPVLYLSRYIIKNKNRYYALLQNTRISHDWEEWILFILDGVIETSKDTIKLIGEIKQLMLRQKNVLREKTKIYSQDLLNNLFRHPYTKIEYIMRDLHVSRITATRYLIILGEAGIVHKIKIGRNNYYFNIGLYELLKNGR
jgi:Fic family protein